MQTLQFRATNKAPEDREIPSPMKFIYLIDDNAAVLDSIGFLLKIEGWTAKSFTSAEAFLAEVETLQAAPIVTDINMPGINGLELTKQLRGRGITSRIIVISAMEGMEEIAWRTGATGFLRKPFQIAELLALVRPEDPAPLAAR